ncbi:multidrug resistance-associated ABC transporter [Mycena rosella]|uniref:Multidrug resistance-associated ABC transporter n=1 Tax=Mycena rosella TaxID=1033263 RepID=A0AAD7CTP6_MYCRO|nr:multidrug resistance-associated ABC transporter [Mycena rosella]
MELCSGSGAFEFGDPCVRSSWSALLPILAVVALSLSALPIRLPAAIKAPFAPYITLHEAEALDLQRESVGDAHIDVPEAVSRGRSFVFAFAGLLQSLAWLTSAAFYFFTAEPFEVWSFTRRLLVALSWLYVTVRPIAAPSATAPYDLFLIFILHTVGGVLLLGGHLFDYGVGEAPLPPTPILIALSANLALVLVLLCVTVQMPMNLPSTRVKKEDIGRSVSPEDYTKLWGWITFNWVYPLVKHGTNETLDDKDVWGLSPTMQSRPVFVKFQSITSATLLRRLVAASSLDLILDFVFTVLSVFFEYSGPFFLKRLLDSIDQPNSAPRDTGMAYIYAGLMFSCSILKSQCDLQHLWYGRRACTRNRSELMAAIYDKALKRKDFSGIVKAEEAKSPTDATTPPKAATKEDKAKAKADEQKADDPKAGADIGKIVNLMSGDADEISFIICTLFFLYGAPFELAIGSVLLYQLLGWSAFTGFAARDKRMGVLDELIGSIKFIKFFAWEERWIDRAMAAREEEMKWMVKSRLNTVMFHGVWSFAPISLSLVSFFTFVWLGNELTVGKAFTVPPSLQPFYTCIHSSCQAIALFNMIRSPLNTVPTYIIHVIQARVSLNRIAVFLEEDEVTDQVSSLKQDLSDPTFTVANEGLGVENASFRWNKVVEEPEAMAPPKTPKSGTPSASSSVVDVGTIPDNNGSQDHRFELKDISVLFPEGHLSVITGPTASGKSALLMALMGEMTLLPGGLDEYGNAHGIAYAAQSPWLRHASIRDNILFGSPMDEKRYDDVIECCALQPDLEMLEDGDATEIGVKGVSLSGGQKARVALARAVYARKKFVLLDDPLSAVDSHTSRFLYEKCLRGPLLANRTVILVTHHVELVLPGAHYVIRMLDGRIDTQGTVRDLRTQGVLEEITHEAAVEVQKEELTLPVDAVNPEVQPEAKKPRKLVEDEHREIGSVKWPVYQVYLAASGYLLWVLLALLVVIQQLRSISEKLWIKIWTAAYSAPANVSDQFMYRSFGTGANELLLSSIPHAHFQSEGFRVNFVDLQWPSASSRPLFYIGVYAAIGMLGIVLQLASVALQYTGALRASRILFKRLLVTVVRATFRFHDTTPQGRMLNRFSKDFTTIDSRLASSLQAVNSSLAGFFVSILTVTVVFPLFLFPASIIGYLYRSLAIGYLNTGRDLRRMESNSRSPIFSDFGELLAGIVTVRAFSAEKRFMDNLHSRIDTTTKMWYSFWMTNRWLLLNFDFLGSVSVFITALFSITFIQDDAGLAGLAITSALNFSESVYWACRFWTELELDLNAVERITEYMDLPQEPPAIIESQRPPAYWPSSAKNNSLVVVEDLSIKYAPDLPSVLQNVSLELKSGERVGLVGRTGSGKSTLAMSLLRFVDPSSGRILVDGIDISKIGIHDLRSRITFIPQDATLFSGTLRDNLDPFGDHEDSVCLDVLRRVHLIGQSEGTSRTQSIAPSPLGSRPSSIHGPDADTSASISTAFTNVDTKTTLSLDTQVSPGGGNFSQGQKQLIAMARALLRRSSIVVMDEATSSVDFATDSKIQSAIREEFTDSLLITVAHRLRTIIDYDRLLVLDKGKVVEFDTPLRLMQKEDGIFRGMCLKSGTFGELEAAAKAKDYTFV